MKVFRAIAFVLLILVTFVGMASYARGSYTEIFPFSPQDKIGVIGGQTHSFIAVTSSLNKKPITVNLFAISSFREGANKTETEIFLLSGGKVTALHPYKEIHRKVAQAARK